MSSITDKTTAKTAKDTAELLEITKVEQKQSRGRWIISICVSGATLIAAIIAAIAAILG